MDTVLKAWHMHFLVKLHGKKYGDTDVFSMASWCNGITWPYMDPVTDIKGIKYALIIIK